MFKKITSLFTKKKSETIEEPVGTIEESEEEIVEEPPPLPDVIEVPWKIAARLKNLDVAQDKVHDDLKEFLYKNKITEKKTFNYLQVLEEAYEKVEKEIKEAYRIANPDDYIFELPEGTGRPGFLKKKKTNK
tara:strand:- start:1239 stop:1634 length:396 start_codon:yes stop_codon:yes gene_type:complete